MPKETFFNLNLEKRERIEEAIKHEFSRVPFSKVSISNIIEEARIPRGSFYQYFEDKEDAVKYIVQKYIYLENEIIRRFLIETNGNIFETTIKIYEYISERILIDSDIKLYKNILEELKNNNINIFDKSVEFEDKQKLDNLIDVQILNIVEKEDINYMLKIVSSITRVLTIDVASNRLSKEEGRKQLIKQLNILKRGMLK
ncbi:MAG: TetR/AcrR family transcriptional regulator [Clostridia bacterium]|nr:TetR/AcrR family transcriptional regulator [Clostridia bacterium]